MKSLIDELKKGNVLISDGAWGTFLNQKGLGLGECPERWNITHADDVYAIAQSYIDAGSDMILTNSFGGSPIKLKGYRLQDRASELNEAAAAISRKAAGSDHFVLGSIGPTGEMLMMNNVTESEMYDGFVIQAAALKKGGVDAICVETMSAIDEATLAVKAAREATGLEVVCTFTFEKTGKGEYRTMMGVPVFEAIDSVKAAGASIIGTNCGNGCDQMIEIVKEIRTSDQVTPVLVHANAGLPIFKNNQTFFPETAEVMSTKISKLVDAGANIIGGCCGTTPDHIRAMVKVIRANQS
ncbi:MAG: homocysteine S-methyltransferase family protein [Methanosarcinaceae archaeon]|nr:homocysteine S-methyltransferase family protein [Methanosarcinaceae archaeon]